MTRAAMALYVRDGFREGQRLALSHLERRLTRGQAVSADPDVSDLRKLAALMEEVGEVARAIHDDAPRSRIREELFDVMTVAGAWAGCEGASG